MQSLLKATIIRYLTKPKSVLFPPPKSYLEIISQLKNKQLLMSLLQFL